MPVDKSKKVQVKVSMPKEIHRQLKDISEATGIPMSTMMLQATIEKYLEGDASGKLR
jgi:predicted DNA-binding protein